MSVNQQGKRIKPVFKKPLIDSAVSRVAGHGEINQGFQNIRFPESTKQTNRQIRTISIININPSCQYLLPKSPSHAKVAEFFNVEQSAC